MAWSSSRVPSISLKGQSLTRSERDKVKAALAEGGWKDDSAWEYNKSNGSHPPATTILPPTTTTRKAIEHLGVTSADLARSNSGFFTPPPQSNGTSSSNSTPSSPSLSATSSSGSGTFSPFTPKYPTTQDDISISAKDIENILAKPTLVKVWNQKKWKALGLAGRSEMKTDKIVVDFKLPRYCNPAMLSRLLSQTLAVYATHWVI